MRITCDGNSTLMGTLTVQGYDNLRKLLFHDYAHSVYCIYQQPRPLDPALGLVYL